tara:strand:+ start:366 stop:1280 length:915 start_codon:yes stop_codon:yes gene_type:complete
MELIGRNVNIKKNNYTKKEKKEIIHNSLKKISLEDAKNDFYKLRQSLCNIENDFKPLSIVGNKTVDYFTREERFDTITKSGMNYYDFIYNKDYFLKKKYVKNLLKKYDLYDVFRLYFGTVSIFKPLIAMSVYCLFNPTSILDFTAGWGGRLIGASVLNIDKYTGIDLNKELEPKYKKMISFLKDKSKTKIKMIFKDALKVDYSKIDYDMVLTSPPYFNIEIYKGTTKRTKEDWIEEFYKPLFLKTFKYLKKNGWYCLNIPNNIFEEIALPLFGKPQKELNMPIVKRGYNIKYSEKIYCWKKKNK